MTKKERMLAALNHQPVDRIPKGEIAIEGGFIVEFIKDVEQPMSAMEKEIFVRKELGFDWIDMHEFPRELMGYAEDGYPIYKSPYGDIFKETPHSFQMLKPALEDIEDVDDYEPADLSVATTHLLDFYRKNTDFFLVSQINGPVSALDWCLGMEDYMCYCMTEPELVAKLADKLMKFELGRAKKFLDHGAEAILMTDDIAYNTGLLLPPDTMKVVAYPYYKKVVSAIKEYKDIPVIFHSDGYLYNEIPNIIDCGFDAIQSIQPSAGMDIVKIKKEYGDKLCLIGNIDLNELLPFRSPEEVKKEVKRVVENMGNTGFILSTCNILTDAVPVENAKAMYFFDKE
ncbi:uroporphyrinogen decarboxylase family protein [Robinsoniella sp. KNHs210]|uniref:uroporphyrinogen decarboxylase family protein n=1 Tax=Robinsoniella sp. KNHs210 TaxID=1469950 RepID=UPI00069327C7|nr:uroporphyrinogen decarboxylase family protein [Robinsoniella sp. KNHs210]